MSSNWNRHRSGFPCPVCGGVTDCRTSLLTGGVHCRRANKADPPVGWRYAKDDAAGFGMFFRDDVDHDPITNEARERIKASEERKRSEPPAVGELPTAGGSAFERIARDVITLGGDVLDALAARLCLPLGVFGFLGVGWLPSDDFNRPAAVFPETNASGQVVGYTLRYADGSKRNHGGRGLSIPAGFWLRGSETVYLCEGASDTLALTAMGLRAIGRPSDRAGVDQLIAVLRILPSDTQFIVVGENDQKADGRHPGREGAEYVAKRLADAREVNPCSGRVGWVLPPTGVKDSRAWIVEHEAAIRDEKATTLREIGGRLAAHFTSTVKWSLPAGLPAAQTETPEGSAAEVAALVDGIVNAPASAVQAGTIDHFAAQRAADIAGIIGCAPRCVPAPSTVSAPVEPPACPRRRSISQTRGRLSQRLLCVDCKLATCMHCGPILRRQHKEAVAGHVAACGALSVPGAVLHQFRVKAGADWTTVSAALRHADASYAGVERDGWRTVWSTEPPASGKIDAAAGVMRVDPSEAVRRFQREVDLIEIAAWRKGVVSCSRDWSLTPQRGEPTGWRGRIPVVTPMETLLGILDEYEIDAKPRRHHDGYFGYVAWEWVCQTPAQREQIGFDLTLGEYTGNVDTDAMFGPAGPAGGSGAEVDEFADAGGDGPPGGGVWVDW